MPVVLKGNEYKVLDLLGNDVTEARKPWTITLRTNAPSESEGLAEGDRVYVDGSLQHICGDTVLERLAAAGLVKGDLVRGRTTADRV